MKLGIYGLVLGASNEILVRCSFVQSGSRKSDMRRAKDAISAYNKMARSTVNFQRKERDASLNAFFSFAELSRKIARVVRKKNVSLHLTRILFSVSIVRDNFCRNAASVLVMCDVEDFFCDVMEHGPFSKESAI